MGGGVIAPRLLLAIRVAAYRRLGEGVPTTTLDDVAAYASSRDGRPLVTVCWRTPFETTHATDIEQFRVPSLATARDEAIKAATHLLFRWAAEKTCAELGVNGP